MHKEWRIGSSLRHREHRANNGAPHRYRWLRRISPGIYARASSCSGHSAAEICSQQYARNGGCCNARAGNSASNGKNRLAAVPITISRRYFHTSRRCRSQRKEGDALTLRAQAVGVALSARSGKVRPTPNREPEISCPLEVRANPAQHPGLCMPRDPSGTAAPSHFCATCFI